MNETRTPEERSSGDDQGAPTGASPELDALQDAAPDQEIAGHGTGETPRLALPMGPVLVVAAHPDDAEVGCGGTLAALAAAGRRVVVAVVTDGTEGGEDPSIPDAVLRDQREAEQRAASAALGINELEFLRFPDGRVQATLELRKAITTLIRRYRPATIFTHDPSSLIGAGYLNHPDHQATGKATLDAIFPAAGNPRSFRELLAEGLQPHKVNAVYLFFTPSADAWIDITGFVELKLAALRCHGSQFAKPEELAKPIWEMARQAGEAGGLAAAEDFRRIVLGPDEDEKKGEAAEEKKG